MFDPGNLLGRDSTEVGAFWQVPANESIGILIRTPLPGCIGTGKVASDPEFGRELLMLGILGSVVQRERLTSLGRQLFQPINDCPVGLLRALARQLGDEDQPALAFDQGVERRLALARDQTVALPVTRVATAFNGFRPGIDRNPVGNRGLSHFSADALIPSLLVGSAQQLDHLQTVRVLGMIDVLVDRFVMNGLPWVVDLDPSGDLLRGPSFREAVLDVLPNESVLQSLVCIRVGLPLAGSGMRPAGNIASSLGRTVPFELA